MIRFFYYVEFKYLLEDGCESCFDLGIFSTKANAEKKIKNSSIQTGFKDYPIQNFNIIKFGVNFYEAKVDKSKTKLFSIQHEYSDENPDVSYYTTFGYFSTYEEASRKVQYLKSHSRIGKKYPDNFEIIEELIDNYNSWSEGFIRY